MPLGLGFAAAKAQKQHRVSEVSRFQVTQRFRAGQATARLLLDWTL